MSPKKRRPTLDAEQKAPVLYATTAPAAYVPQVLAGDTPRIPAACPTPRWCAVHGGPCRGERCRFETEKGWSPQRRGAEIMTEQNLSSFTRWLGAQTERQDPVGDLARDVAADRDWPLSAKTVESYEGYLARRGADPNVISALFDAWAEYDAERDRNR